MQDLHDLELLVDSRVAIIAIESHEERRVLDLLVRLGVSRQRKIYSWSVIEGLRRIDVDEGPGDRMSATADAALQRVFDSQEAAIHVFCDLHPFLTDNPRTVRLLKEIALRHDITPHTLVLLSHAISLPPEVRRYGASVRLRLPDETEILNLVREEALHWMRANPARKVRTDNRALGALVANLRGLTFGDVRRLARGAICDDGAITLDDLPSLNRAKFDLLDMGGVLSFEYDTASFADVGGLTGLRAWLEQRRPHFLQVPASTSRPQAAAQDGLGDTVEILPALPVLDVPRGITLLGVQGCGKSLASKAVAGLFGVPLLRLDMGALYNKFIGETERQLRESLALADMMAPCVLWIDEIEKGLNQDGGSDGVGKRVLGSLLTWMAERTSRVFLVATSNDISSLPPELIRKGRIDEIFFVDLPGRRVRQDILGIHLRKRGQEPASFDLATLADVTEGFGGAELEQVVVAALYAASAEKVRLETSHLRAQVTATVPLSVLMGEQIQALRDWARDRTVKADADEGPVA